MRLCYRKVIIRDYQWEHPASSHMLYRHMTISATQGPVVPYILNGGGAMENKYRIFNKEFAISKFFEIFCGDYGPSPSCARGCHPRIPSFAGMAGLPLRAERGLSGEGFRAGVVGEEGWQSGSAELQHRRRGARMGEFWRFRS
jgi:hypothetical protein